MPPVHFVETAGSSGLDFTHVNGMIGERWLAEIVGAGVGVLDFDGDGRLDIWLVQGGPLKGRVGPLPYDRLFRNVSTRGKLRFEDVTEKSGVHADRYGMGIATGDIDNDGDLDVFLANFGPNQLYENLGDGRFRDITESSGLKGDEWSVSASFADIDGDGLDDLYVGNYLDFTLDTHKDCRDVASRAVYCAPESYGGVPDRLYRNLGAGRFVDISASSGIAAATGGALGVVAHDFDADGDTDFYVANDGVENFLWMNQGELKFVNEALLAGVAVNANGAPEASMGVDAEDFDEDCDVDLFLTHLATETNTLYVNDGGAWFMDGSNRAGLGASSGPFTGFGTGWFDADNDGDLDLFSANGSVSELPEQRDAGMPYPLRQRNQLWLNDGNGRYSEHRVPAFDVEEVSRGAAFADLDADGDTDIVVSNSNGPARLYRNDSRAAWIGLDLREATDRTAIGAFVGLDSKSCGFKRIATDGSYASANDSRALFGLGSDGTPTPQYVRVRWPDDSEQRFGPLAPNRYHRLMQSGSGRTP